MTKVIDNKPYNGHTNWATWNVNLWLDNDEGLYRDYCSQAQRRAFTADSAEEYVKEIMPSGTPDFSSPNDYADVDWESIAENMNESAGVEPEEDDEEEAESEESQSDKFIEKYSIRISKQERTDRNDHMFENMDHWKVTMLATVDGKARQYTLTFSQSYGYKGMPPALASILECLQSDCSSFEGRSFEDWASELGFDADSRKALATFKAVEKQVKEMKRWLGPDGYDSFLSLEW